MSAHYPTALNKEALDVHTKCQKGIKYSPAFFDLLQEIFSGKSSNTHAILFIRFNNTIIMKNPISIFLLLFLALFSCTKFETQPGTVGNVQAGTNPPIETDMYEVVAVNRDGCCCSLVVSSTYFGGLTICGLIGEGGDDCRFCTIDCGTSCGSEFTFPQGKNHTVCFDSGCPFSVRNNGFLPIQIFFICPSGNSTPVWIPASGTIYMSNDCSGTFTNCTPTDCE